MTRIGVLVDVRKCIGCRSCQVACKRWHDLPAEETKLTQSWTNPPKSSRNTWTYLRLFEVNPEKGDVPYRFRGVKWQCMHCGEAPCVTVCPANALYKTTEGMTLYDENRCIGCRYCIAACPFHVPHFDWSKNRVVQKCTFCVEKIMEFKSAPICVSSCPTGALTFYTDRDEMMQKVEIEKQNGAYVFGDKQLGGLSWVYISDISVEKYVSDDGTKVFPKNEKLTSPKEYQSTLLTRFAAIGIVGGLALIGLKVYSDRRKAIEDQKKKMKTKKETKEGDE